MPVVSRAQQGYMAMSKTSEGRAKLRASGHKPVPANVANEFLKSSAGMKSALLPHHVRKHG